MHKYKREAKIVYIKIENFYITLIKYFQNVKKYAIIEVLVLQKETEIFKFERCEKEIPFRFRVHTTIGCGGTARVGYFPASEEELIGLTIRLTESHPPYVVVGNMSNVLPPDGFTDKTVICTKLFRECLFDETGVYVSAGLSAGALLRSCEQHEKTGVEFLEGIPCTLGGALYMNAGVSGAYIAERVQYVKALHKSKVVLLDGKDCQYAYKSSVFMQEDFLILGAKLKLDTAGAQDIRQKKCEYKERRKHLPKGKSMGCVFKNPQGQIAGKLIEGAGLKGLRVGGAKVSEQHANFIINDGYATSAHIRELIGIVRGAVEKQYGVLLQEEIRYL